jgi:serine/threonine protein phosphatase PrpC
MSDKEARRPVPQGQDAATVPSVPAAPPLDLQIIRLTDVGRLRPHNEDYVDYCVPPDPRQRERKGAMFLVADGMGGHQAGEVASRGAVELVIKEYYGDTGHDVGTSLVRAFRAANQQIYSQAQADPSKAGMGTTLVAAVILGRKVYLANVGDSRAYLINEKGISQITEDHSWVEEQVRAGLLSPEQAYRHPQRNLLTRALGSKPAVEVDLFEGELGEGDSLLLCSDGLTGRVEDAEIASVVQEHPAEEAARLLVAQANERGGNDNISVLIVSDRQEMPTVAAPMLAGAGKEPARSLPLIPILGGVVGLLVLALIALLAAPVLFGGKATPTPTPTVSPPAPEDTGVATLELGPTPEATVVLTGTLPAEGEGTPAGPTATLAATFTPAPPSPTFGATNPPSPLNTPQASPTSAGPTGSAPTLQEPTEGAELPGEVTFVWSYSKPLLGNSQFQVLIWQEGQSQHNGAAEFTSSTSQRIDLAQVPQIRDGGPGQYSWSVVVVDAATGRRTSPEAFSRRFFYTGPQEPAPQPARPSPTPKRAP